MFESRVRKHVKERSKRKVFKIYDDDDACNIPIQHINRATPGLLQHAFESAREQLFTNNINPIHEEIKLLKEVKKHIKNDPNTSLNEYRDLIDTLKEKKEALIKSRFEKYNWNKQCTLLRPGKLSSLVQANRLLKRPPEIYLLDSERCSICHIPYKFNNAICKFRCEKCSVLRSVLYLPEDNSADRLILKAKTSGTDNQVPKRVPNNNKLKYNQTQSMLDEQRRKKINDFINNYKEFLSQYRDNVPPTPDEVRSLLALRLSPVHLCGKSKCRLPTVRLILQQSKKFAHLEKHAERIMRDYIGQEIPKLSQDTVDRLIQRFSHLFELGMPVKKMQDITESEVIMEYDTMIKQEPEEQDKIIEEEQETSSKPGNDKKREDVKRKIFQSEVITMMLLLIDDNREEAYKFFLHKTRSVLNECNEIYLELVTQARIENPTLWPMNDANLL